MSVPREGHAVEISGAHTGIGALGVRPLRRLLLLARVGLGGLPGACFCGANVDVARLALVLRAVVLALRDRARFEQTLGAFALTLRLLAPCLREIGLRLGLGRDERHRSGIETSEDVALLHGLAHVDGHFDHPAAGVGGEVRLLLAPKRTGQLHGSGHGTGLGCLELDIDRGCSRLDTGLGLTPAAGGEREESCGAQRPEKQSQHM
jgi:hypothetical protein